MNEKSKSKTNDDQRGGIITSVGILRVTSAPEKTNPVRRGVWMLDRIIGRKMHAPENVPALSKSQKVNGKQLVYLDSSNSSQKPLRVINRLNDLTIARRSYPFLFNQQLFIIFDIFFPFNP